MTPSLTTLIELLEHYRSDKGCAWTGAQTWQSLAPQTVEEVYELTDAIASGDNNSIKDECADLLYHVLFYCALGKEAGLFDLETLAEHTLAKHLGRMPSSEQLARLSKDEVNDHWQAMKAQKRSADNSDLFTSIPSGLPPLARAVALQKKAAAKGFNWSEVAPIIEKLHEETAELEQALANQDKAHIEEEIGDLFFTVANIARFLNIDADLALQKADQKFAHRVNKVCMQIEADGKKIDQLSPEQLESYWQKHKKSP